MLTTKPKKSGPTRRPVSIVLVLNDQANSRAATPEVPHSMSLIAFKDAIEFTYLLDNFVWRTYGTPWLEMSCSGRLGDLPLQAARGFAQSVFGKHHHQTRIELQGQAWYGKAVRSLSQELNHVARPGGENLIISVLLLLMHASTAADRQGAVIHVTGLNKVFQSCEPARFAKMPLRLAFESARSTLFTIGLVSKRRIFLEQESWKTLPWCGVGLPPKSPQNELVDIMVNIPGYMEVLASLQTGQASAAQVAHLVANLKEDLSFSYQWRWKWEAKNPNAAWELAPSEVPTSRVVSKVRLFEKVLWFRTFTHATELLLYNAVLLCLLGLLWQLEPPPDPESQGPTSVPLVLPCEVVNLIEPAEEICRGFEYQLLNVENSRESALFWLLPLGIAAKVLEREPKYGRWIQAMLDTSKVTRGYGTGMSEFAFGHYQFPHIGHPRQRRT